MLKPTMNRVLIFLKEKKTKIFSGEKNTKSYQFIIEDKGSDVSEDIKIGKEAVFHAEKLKAMHTIEVEKKLYAIVEDTDIIAIQ